jgi:hypothetical protein
LAILENYWINSVIQLITSNSSGIPYGRCDFRIWCRGEALTLEALIKRAKQYGYQEIETDGMIECTRYAEDAGVILATQINALNPLRILHEQEDVPALGIECCSNCIAYLSFGILINLKKYNGAIRWILV